MHWQLGGNFGPVLKACENRWMECSYALAHYIWFEVVTDVADSLANELILWRILAVILILMTIVHFMYWKQQWIKEISVTNKTLKELDFKVKDLELKINILTYKAQYDTWPLTQLVALTNESDSESNLSIFPKLTAQNTYLKYFLARTRRKEIDNKALTYKISESQALLKELNICDLKTKCMPKTSYIEKTSLEQKRVQTEKLGNKRLKNNLSTINLSEEPTTEENYKLYRSSSDSSLNDHLRSSYLGSKKITKINVKPGKLLHRKRSEIAEKQLKFSVSSTNNSSASKNILFPKFLKQKYHSSYEDNSAKEEPDETLNQVKEKLQCLYSTLPNFPDDFETNTLNTYNSPNKASDNIKKTNTSQNKNKYDHIKNQRGDYNYDECISLKKSNHPSITSKVVNPDVIKKDKSKKITSQTNESDNEELKKRNNLNSYTANHELNSIHLEDANILSESNNTTDRYYVETDETKIIQAKETITDSDDNQQNSLVEMSKGSDSDDKSVTALIQEALKFKQELLLQIESRKEKDEIGIESISNQMQSYDYSKWHSDSDFEPNSLDKITEESSGSSVVDKNSKTCILINADNCNNQITNNGNICLPSHLSSNEIVENSTSNKNTSSNEILLANNGKQTLPQSTEEIYHSNLNMNLKIDTSFNQLSETSSDTSVNRLLDRLIESERKCKTAKSSTNSKIEQNAADSLHKFIIPHTFFGTERNFVEKIDSGGIQNYENKNFDSASLNTDDSTTVIKSMSELQNDEVKNKNVINQKDAGDFYSDSEVIAQKTVQNSTKNVFPSGDANSLESNTFTKSAVKLRSNLYHSFCKGQTGNNFQAGFKHSEQFSAKANKNSSSNLTQKQSTKTDFELGNSKQLKAKSNLNLSSVECVNALPTHRRSKSQVIAWDIPFMNQNKKGEIESIPIQVNTDENKGLEERKENACTSLEVSKKSFSKPCTSQSSRNCSNEIQLEMKENNSTVPSSKSSSNSSTTISKDSKIENNSNKNDLKRKPSNESVCSKSSTKSGMPKLKTRLELALNSDNDVHSKHSTTGSFKMNVEFIESEKNIDKFEENVEKQVNQNLSELTEGKDVIFKNSSGACDLEYSTDSHDYVSTYVNTMIDNIQFDTGTNNEKQMFDDHESELVVDTIVDKQTSFIPKQEELLDSLVKYNDDLINVIAPEISPIEVQSISSRVLPHKDSKETEVLVKPCTLDTSTSMTDVTNLKDVPVSKANELKILEVPEQLSKEEYVTLLQLINDHPDFEHLLNLGLQK